MSLHRPPTAEGIGGPRPTADLLDVDEVARRLSCSKRSVYRLTDAGKIPPPIRLGGMVRWRAGELADWLAAGCPDLHRRGRGGAA